MDHSLVTTGFELTGRRISRQSELCEKARTEAYELVIQHARAVSADPV